MNKYLVTSLIGASMSLGGCATGYHQQNITGGFTDVMVAPNEAAITVRGNGFTGPDRAIFMAGLRAAELTMQHGYRYFVMTEFADMSTQSNVVIPGSSYTTGNAYASGSAYRSGNYIYGSASAVGSSQTTFMPAQSIPINRPGLMITIKMSNNIKELEPLGAIVRGVKVPPREAAFMATSLKQYLNVKS